MAELRSAVSRNDTKLQQQDEIIKRLEDVQQQVRTLLRQQRDMVDAVNTSRQVVAALKTALEPRVEALEAAIDAIDGSRQQSGVQWNRLRARLEALEEQIEETPAAP